MLFQETLNDNSKGLATIYKNPNCAIAADDIKKGELHVSPSSSRISTVEGGNDIDLGSYSISGVQTNVYIQKDIRFPSEKDANGFLPPFWFVETTKQVEHGRPLGNYWDRV